MIRSLHEIRRDPNETPLTGGASGRSDQKGEIEDREAIPRPPATSVDQSTPGDVTPRVTRQSSRPQSQRAVRGRSKADKRRRHPDSGDRRSTRHKADPIVVTPPVTIPNSGITIPKWG